MAAIALGSVLVLNITQIILTSLRITNNQARAVQAEYLAIELMEQVRFMRDGDWTNLSSLSSNTPYYLGSGGPPWNPQMGSETMLSIFSRSFTLSDICRDPITRDISTLAGCIADPDTKKVTATIQWEAVGEGTKIHSLELYLTHWQ
ncbi:MAG: hypothetical protein AUK21_03385 [Parcubacteria group bacterium CG2_30_48_51]|nr:MAG: hypothetical protein AUK21_03385 [Parcubacteria group bacterium CG2_30_48_51]